MSGLPFWIEVVVAAFAVLSGGAAFVSALSSAASRESAHKAQEALLGALDRSASAAEDRNRTIQMTERLEFASNVRKLIDKRARELEDVKTIDLDSHVADFETLLGLAERCTAPNADRLVFAALRPLTDARSKVMLGNANSALFRRVTGFVEADLAAREGRMIVKLWASDPGNLDEWVRRAAAVMSDYRAGPEQSDAF